MSRRGDKDNPCDSVSEAFSIARTVGGAPYVTKSVFDSFNLMDFVDEAYAETSYTDEEGYETAGTIRSWYVAKYEPEKSGDAIRYRLVFDSLQEDHVKCILEAAQEHARHERELDSPEVQEMLEKALASRKETLEKVAKDAVEVTMENAREPSPGIAFLKIFRGEI